jgi:hypothetical protein
MDLGLRHLGARGGTQSIAAHQGGNKFRRIGNRRVHRASGAHFTTLIMFLWLALIVPAVCEVGGDCSQAGGAIVWDAT